MNRRYCLLGRTLAQQANADSELFGALLLANRGMFDLPGLRVGTYTEALLFLRSR